jgi:hypothetical protein
VQLIEHVTTLLKYKGTFVQQSDSQVRLLSVYDSEAVAFVNCITIFNFTEQRSAAEIRAYFFAISLSIHWQEDGI